MTQGLVLVLSDDLIFTSRIAATVRSVGGQIRDCRDWPTLVQSAEALQPACVIIDLQNPGLNLAELVGRLLRVGEGTRPRLVAYGSHVRTAVLKQARQLGVDEVMPRSRFVEVLEGSMPGWLGLAGAGADDQPPGA
jgi:CheY-like chemotaxis protein